MIASVQLSAWANGNLKVTCTVVRPSKLPDLLPALEPRIQVIVQFPVMPCRGAAQMPALIETGLSKVAALGSQMAKSPRELHEPMLRVTVGVAAGETAADAETAPAHRAATPAIATPRVAVFILSHSQDQEPGAPGAPSIMEETR